MNINVEFRATCTRSQALDHIRFDHQRVNIGGKAGVMLTYDWPDPIESEESFVLRVVFAYADEHPIAPVHIQNIVSQLNFTHV